jgi:N-acetylglucosamine malate deacetylase 1
MARNILAIGAHYDDVELGCSGTLVKHVNAGDNVTIVVVTDSEYRGYDGNIVRGGEIAHEEGITAAKLIGGDLICLDYGTFEVPFDERLTTELGRIVTARNIDTVYAHWIHDIHRDHQFAGRCALMAGRHVPRFLMFRSNFYDSDRTFRGNFYSDISDEFGVKLDVIKAHKSELERVRYKWTEFFTNQNANDGQKIGVTYAECFEVVRYLV